MVETVSDRVVRLRWSRQNGWYSVRQVRLFRASVPGPDGPVICRAVLGALPKFMQEDRFNGKRRVHRGPIRTTSAREKECSAWKRVSPPAVRKDQLSEVNRREARIRGMAAGCVRKMVWRYRWRTSASVIKLGKKQSFAPHRASILSFATQGVDHWTPLEQPRRSRRWNSTFCRIE